MLFKAKSYAMKLSVLLAIFATLGYASGDCYPGDVAFTKVVQQIYKGVTFDNIILTYISNAPMNRHALCSILVRNHNYGKNPGQLQTNRNYLGVFITQSACVNALTYTTGYNSLAGWQKWAGYHSGKWYAKETIFDDDAQWNLPYTKYDPGQSYAVQSVRFDSQLRKDKCTYVDPATGATCRNGWNQSGQGIQYVWGWDPKDNDCPSGYARGRRGAHVGFPFNQGTMSCIVWVTTEEAFLECIKNSRRTSTSSGPSEGYGQWTVST